MYKHLQHCIYPVKHVHVPPDIMETEISEPYYILQPTLRAQKMFVNNICNDFIKKNPGLSQLRKASI